MKLIKCIHALGKFSVGIFGNGSYDKDKWVRRDSERNLEAREKQSTTEDKWSEEKNESRHLSILPSNNKRDDSKSVL